MKKIYLVIGEAGAYSDYSTWVVKAFNSRPKALLHARLCRKHVPKNDKFEDDFYDAKNPHDPQMQLSWNYGTTYRVEEVQLVG